MVVAVWVLVWVGFVLVGVCWLFVTTYVSFVYYTLTSCWFEVGLFGGLFDFVCFLLFEFGFGLVGWVLVRVSWNLFVDCSGFCLVALLGCFVCFGCWWIHLF